MTLLGGSVGGRARQLYARLFPAWRVRTLLLRRWLVLPVKRLFGHEPRPAAAVTVSSGVDDRLRVLIVTHEAPGGVAWTTRDLASALAGSCNVHRLAADPHRMLLESWAPDGQPCRVGEWWRPRPWSAVRWRDPWARDLYRRCIAELRPDIIHVRHLLAHSLDLIDVGAELEVPVVVSLHDFYPLCPGIHLLDATGTYCAGRCPERGGRCQVPIHWLENLEISESGFIQDWRRNMGGALAQVSHLITTSSSTLELYHEHLPLLQSVPTSIIEHGRDIPRRSLAPEPPTESQNIRILLPAVSGPHKGSEFIRALAEHDHSSANRLELHTIGTTDPNLRGLTIDHGPYDREDLPDRIAAIRPHFVGIFSTWPETYSHVLTEAWSQGIPVLVSPLGALAERVTRHHAGWILPLDNPTEAHSQVLEIASDSKANVAAVAQTTTIPIPTIAEMAEQYLDVYTTVRERAGSRIG